MPYKSLPSNPSLDHLRHQARDLQGAFQCHELQALQRVREFHSRFRNATDEQILAANLALSDAQLIVAREYCFPSWTKLKSAVQSGESQDSNRPLQERIADPVFRKAVDLMDSGDELGLKSYLQDHPEVVRQRVFFSMSDYFGQPTLLEFAAENPHRHGKLPPNIVDVVKVVLDAGARYDSQAIDRALGLVCSGNVARQCGVQTALIEMLCTTGANPNSAMSTALVHGEFEAVQALLRNGAKIDLPTAAALGRIDEAQGLITEADDDSRHRALAYASQFGRVEIVRMLLDAGVDPNRFNPVGGHSHSTPLHQAALAGHLDVVRFLVERGARTDIEDILYHSTPLGWAEHGGKADIVEYLQGFPDEPF
jgi:hypothetical protein